MKNPKFGKNKIHSFIDFETTFGKVRFGVQGKQLFVELNESIVLLTETDGKLSGSIVKDPLKANTATTDGLTTGQLTGAKQFVVVTSGNANHIISLPKAADIPIGTKIKGMVNATGFELRAHPSDVSSVAINNISGANTEAAIVADTSFQVELISATEWILTALTNLGAELVIVPDAL